MSTEDHAADRRAHTATPTVDLPDFPVPSHDPRAVSDAIRPGSRIALSSSGSMVLLRHADVLAATRDTEVFSSAVSRFLQLPNGLDGAEHAAFRRLIEPYFTDERMAALEPEVREVARQVCAELVRAAGAGAVGCDAVGELGSRFAVRAMTRWLGWPADLEPTLLEWMADNQAPPGPDGWTPPRTWPGGMTRSSGPCWHRGGTVAMTRTAGPRTSLRS